jgi:hypothetical protein
MILVVVSPVLVIATSLFEPWPEGEMSLEYGRG